MNTLFIIGNGFDLNLGIKTSYSNFYEYYKEMNSKSDLIKKLKEDISNNEIKEWKDLELALGQYTKKLKTREEFKEISTDIIISLSDYLKKQEESFDFGRINKDVFFSNLSFPEKHLPEGDIDEIKSYRGRWYNTLQWHTSIMTLNYTRTIENITERTDIKNIQIGGSSPRKFLLREIMHIHGRTDANIVLGVNDISQIANESFHEDLNILETLVKPTCNQVQKHKIDTQCKGLISNANLICLFGSSIGDTDSMWWELVGQRLLSSNARLIIFHHTTEVIPQQMPQIKSEIGRRVISLFAKMAKLNDEEIKRIGDRIIVGVNTGIFKQILPS